MIQTESVMNIWFAAIIDSDYFRLGGSHHKIPKFHQYLLSLYATRLASAALQTSFWNFFILMIFIACFIILDTSLFHTFYWDWLYDILILGWYLCHLLLDLGASFWRLTYLLLHTGHLPVWILYIRLENYALYTPKSAAISAKHKQYTYPSLFVLNFNYRHYYYLFSTFYAPWVRFWIFTLMVVTGKCSTPSCPSTATKICYFSVHTKCNMPYLIYCILLWYRLHIHKFITFGDS